MKAKLTIDPFFSDQPPKDFIAQLKQPIHTAPPPGWMRDAVAAGEADLHRCRLCPQFPEEEGLLETIYADFRLFLDVYGMADASPAAYPVYTVRKETECFEAYTVTVTDEACTVSAADTEGIRRGLIFVEDELRRRNGPYLPLGSVHRHPYIRARISRCFFSPINRPPKNGEELADEIDYYPEEYLNRLAHDGVNGVWIYTHFCDLVPSDLIPEYGQDAERRVKKLNATVAKCRRYGIRPYVFSIEPQALRDPEMIRKYPEVRGATLADGWYTFCTNTPFGKAYCEEAVRRLFTMCPGIGGLILITMGERSTACGSGSMQIDCPHCRDKKIGEVLSQTVDALADGLRHTDADGEFVSWTYGHRLWTYDAVRDYVRSAPDDVMLMQNFEEMGYPEQLGKTRLAVDYWLSYPGPSRLFEETAKEANASHKHLYAKTQVCCSHEIASVPYVPVPGILYDKYKAMRRYGVEGVMQCWYFGNYPSLMSKAAGELAFEGAFADKNAFLRRLAAIDWGERRADAVVQAWNAFETGYRAYPINIMFSYFGPMHDGPVWELQLEPKNFMLPRTWQTTDPVNGDRIGECLLSGHTTDEAVTLCQTMLDHWEKGTKLLPAGENYPAWEEQRSVAAALEIQMRSGLNILRFYRLRDLLGREEGDPAAQLACLRAIVIEEQENSRKLAALCEKDPRLGYHSEGEGFKYFPKKLLHRVKQLQTLLETEFPETERRIAAHLPPLAYYCGEEPDSTAYRMPAGAVSRAPWMEFCGKSGAFRASIDGDSLVMEVRSQNAGDWKFAPEFRLMWPDPTVTVSQSGSVSVSDFICMYYQLLGEARTEEVSRWHVSADASGENHLCIRLALCDILRGQKLRPMKLRIQAPGGDSLIGLHVPAGALGKPDLYPEDFVWLIPESF